jgi:hypothetical protein
MGEGLKLSIRGRLIVQQNIAAQLNGDLPAVGSDAQTVTAGISIAQVNE